MSIEKSIEKLTVISDIVTNEQISLEDSMKAFEEGVKIAEETLKKLEEYKGKLVVLQEKVENLTNEN